MTGKDRKERKKSEKKEERRKQHPTLSEQSIPDPILSAFYVKQT